MANQSINTPSAFNHALVDECIETANQLISDFNGPNSRAVSQGMHGVTDILRSVSGFNVRVEVSVTVWCRSGGWEVVVAGLSLEREWDLNEMNDWLGTRYSAEVSSISFLSDRALRFMLSR